MSCLLLVAASCVRPVPEHLRIEPETEASRMPDVSVSDMPTAVAAMVGSDPLARSPRLLPPSLLDKIAGSDGLADFSDAIRRIERGDGLVNEALQQVESQWRETAVVPLSRGYRLRVAENHLATYLQNAGDAQDALVSLITPLRPINPEAPHARSALAWLGRDVTPEEVRAYADRWVLTGWLAHPRVPSDQVSPLLEAEQYDELRATPLGVLVRARHGEAADADPDRVNDGFKALRLATSLALQQAAADRDREQAAWADRRTEVAGELGATDPIASLLEHAQSELSAHATDPRAAGGALLAFAARRWTETCGQAPCDGVDRVETMRFAANWDPGLAPLAAIWQVVALKESLDTLDVGHDTALFPEGLADLVDALLGTGSGPLGASLLRRGRADAATWLEIGRAVGEDGVVDWPGARAAVGRHLQTEAAAAYALATDEEVRGYLSTIRQRAIP